MTSRRSMQTNAARTSRAFQFLPGHVGGRVASAQPVRRRAAMGYAGTAVEDPEAAVVWSHVASSMGQGATFTYTPPTPPDGTASTMVFMNYHGDFSNLQHPGWTLLDQGDGTDTLWRLLVHYGSDGGGPITWDIYQGYLALYGAHFIGGSGFGWNSNKGPMTYTGTTCGYSAPASQGTWMQMGMLAHPWGGVTQIPVGIDAVSYSGTVGAYCYPAPGTYSRSQWSALMARAPFTVAADGEIEYVANFGYSEQPIALYWT